LKKGKIIIQPLPNPRKGWEKTFKDMSDLRKKFITIFIPIIGLLIWSLIIMIKSFSTDETWRIVFSTIGFIGFFTLTSLLVNTMIKKREKEKEQ